MPIHLAHGPQAIGIALEVMDLEMRGHWSHTKAPMDSKAAGANQVLWLDISEMTLQSASQGSYLH
jgi:hypothetical protein